MFKKGNTIWKMRINYKHSDETKKKIGIGNKGKIVSEESRIKIGLATKGRKYSLEINKKKGHPREANPNWKGGKYKNLRGYIYILMPEHPFCKKSGYVKRATLVMEKHLGRYLIPPEFVHHKNAPDDDRIKSLHLCANQSEHRKLYSTC